LKEIAEILGLSDIGSGIREKADLGGKSPRSRVPTAKKDKRRKAGTTGRKHSPRIQESSEKTTHKTAEKAIVIKFSHAI